MRRIGCTRLYATSYPQVRHPAMIVRQPYAILSIRSVQTILGRAQAFIGKLSRPSRYKILMRRARRDIKFARLGKILIRHGVVKFKATRR